MRRRPSASNLDDENNADSRLSDDINDALHHTTEAMQTAANPYLNPSATQHKARAKMPRTANAPTTAWEGLQLRTTSSGANNANLPLMDAKDDLSSNDESEKKMHRLRLGNTWSPSWLTLGVLVTASILLFGLFKSFTTLQLDPKGAGMSYMASSFIPFDDFDTEHTRFATKYSLYMYRELGVDEDPRVKGVPVLFIPGNAGSYKQVRSLASEAERYYDAVVKNDANAAAAGKRGLDFFTVDFNEDFTAFHGQTLLDQAEFLNDAVSYILSLYHNPHRSRKDAGSPDPSSVILIGHSMGGIVARTMLTMSNYQSSSVNTIITLSAPHARPPVSFDSQMVATYKTINDYWRKSYAKEWGMDNPLWHVTLVSIAGGGLDSIVPSDYSSISSLVPETHGFTVFTTSIPTVWTGMDHLAITWCDELRKVIIKSLFDVMDVGRPAQTKPRGERIRVFKSWFLTGLEPVVEKNLPQQDAKTLLTLEENSDLVLQLGERLVIRQLGQAQQAAAHFLPVPPQGSLDRRTFTLLTSAQFTAQGDSDQVDVLFCSVYPLQVGQVASLLTMKLDLAGDGHNPGSTKLACKNGAQDIIQLPASTQYSQFAFDKNVPFSYIQYDADAIAEHQFVAIIDKANNPSEDFLIAEFGLKSEATISAETSIQQIIRKPLQWTLPVDRPMLMNINVPALESSLLAYHLKISPNACGSGTMFRNLVRQYVSEVYESKFFVNAEQVDVNIHGVAPYMPPPTFVSNAQRGISIQIWTDPTCAAPLEVSLSLDVLGSFGKSWMRYRTFFATFPLVVVALVLARQFKIYDQTGLFIGFTEGLNMCLRRDVPILLLTLVVFPILKSSWSAHDNSKTATHLLRPRHGNGTESMSDFALNNLLMGSTDTFFWFLLPLFGIISSGLCILINYLVLFVTFFVASITSWISRQRRADPTRRPTTFVITSTKQRLITTSVLLALVATVLPYQFAYLVLCIVQLVTTIRARGLLSDVRSETVYNFYNYAHSLLVLMIWILPINLPVLIVWVRNLAVQWLSPFSSHHNILSILPFILLIETAATGKMVPRLNSQLRFVTSSALVTLALFAAIYGVSYAYALHQVANLFCAWMVLVLWYTNSLQLEKVIEDVVAVSSPSAASPMEKGQKQP